MSATHPEKAKLYWAARRGMLELDLFLMPFVENVYETLSAPEQTCFAQLVSCTDVELYHWLTDKEPAPAQFAALVKRIQDYARARAKSQRE